MRGDNSHRPGAICSQHRSWLARSKDQVKSPFIMKRYNLLLYWSREWIIVNVVMTEQIGSPKGKRGIDETTLKKFLEWLSEDSYTAGKEYLHIRLLMVTYFTRKACPD